MLVPEAALQWPDPAGVPLSRRIWLPVMIPICALMGAVLLAVLLMIPIWLISLDIIGVGVRHIGIAASLGALIGSILGGLLGYRLCRD